MTETKSLTKMSATGRVEAVSDDALAIPALKALRGKQGKCQPLKMNLLMHHLEQASESY
jgi:hypothetical protein